MKNKKKVFGIILIIVILSIISALFFILYNAHNDGLYKTDILGEWSTGDGQLNITFTDIECKHRLAESYYEKSSFSLMDIGDNLQYIENEASVPNYKYYNTIGNYQKTDGIPDTPTFDLIVYYGHSSFKCQLTVDGNYIFSICTKKNPNVYEIDSSYEYYRNEDIIYEKGTKNVLFYIIDDGLYKPVYYKVK